jgi:predicted phage-related endonuclease
MSVYLKGCPEFLEPGSDEHRKIITPSKVAAILGVSRWQSPFSLWHQLKGLTAPEPQKDAFEIGHDMEAYAAARWTRRNPGWHISAHEVQYHVPDGHFPFPACATIDRRASRGRWRRNVEVKIARDLGDLERFGDDLTGEAPEDYSAQCIAQRMFCAAAQPSVTWLQESALFVIGPYFNEREYIVEYDPGVAAWIIESCAEFWESLQSDSPPPLDSSVATYEALRTLHSDIDPDLEVDLNPTVAEEFLTATTDFKIAESAARLAKTRVLDAMGRARYARCNGTLIARRQPSSRGSVALYAAKGSK